MKFKEIFEKLKSLALTKGQNVNKSAKKEQLRYATLVILVFIAAIVFYKISASEHKDNAKAEELAFDGVFDHVFTQNSDEALIAKQQLEIDKISDTLKAKEKAETEKSANDSNETKALMQDLSAKLKLLEDENKQINEKLQLTLLQNSQTNTMTHPPTKSQVRENLEQRHRAELEVFEHARLETVHFHKNHKKEEHNSKNYVWAGTFAEGVLLTGILGDAGVNGSKNMGTAMIRLTSNGIMPNDKRSHLEGCFALVSSFGDLSGSSVVLHLETLSCAGKNINFEQKAYGSVFDLDAMQDLRGTSILKTKPLLSYTAAAGALAGFGDGLKSYGNAQTINPGAGTITMYGGGQAIAQSAAGGALSNPANRISDYIMKIADMYHPLVVAKAGRRVSVLFTKGFWIDHKHQVYESARAIDEDHHEEPAHEESHQATSESTLTNINNNDALTLTPNSNVTQAGF